ncbi:hypothetical protein RU86_GL001203 [Lactococcus piscium]|uniref:Uncharacterized protein n=1 Tax=Pseudolactococcus piscium TaxID=1364 RepID=A0A2A5RVM9_9LACT|nr:hypothetical protein RU86_GL001203 [Lactococcus piscium]
MQKEIGISNQDGSVLSKRTFNRYEEKKQIRLIRDLTFQIANLPQLIEQLSKGKEIALNVSKEFATKIANGELEFIRKGNTGEAVGILRDATSKKMFAQLPIKELPLELGSSIATAGLSMQLQEISHKLEELGDKINRVNRNFDLNRYAEVQSAQDKYKLALLSKDLEVKKTLLIESLSQGTYAYNLLLNQLYETKMNLRNSNNNENVLSNLFKSKADEQAKLAETALDNLEYLKDAFSFQIATLAELREYDALNYALQKFNEVVSEDFSGDDALFLDGHLPPKYKNPFKYLSGNVIDATTSIIEFIDDNEDLLELHFLPSELKIQKKEQKENVE